jgi:hypothetical protein
VRKGLAHKSRTRRKASGSKRDLVRAIPVFGKEKQVRARPFRAGPYARRKRRSPNPASGFRPKVTVPRANAGSRTCFLRLLNFTSRPLRRVRCSELLSFRVSTLARGASRNEEKLGTRLGPAEFRGDRTSTRQLQCKEPGPGFFRCNSAPNNRESKTMKLQHI